MFTTTLTVSQAWLTDPVSDPGGASVVAGTVLPQEASASVDGEFRIYAGGAIRPVLRVTHGRLYPVQFKLLTAADVSQLEKWLGTVLLLRTTDGQRRWGSYLQYSVARRNFVSRSDGTSGTFYDVTLTFTETTPPAGIS